MATMRNTKAELLALLEQHEQRQANGPSLDEIITAARRAGVVTWREFRLLVRDTYNAGALARQAVSRVSQELSRPVLR